MFSFQNETFDVMAPSDLAQKSTEAAGKLAKLHSVSDELKAELATLDTDESREKFTEPHLRQERLRVRDTFIGKAAEINGKIGILTERGLSEQSFWDSPTRLLRSSRLTARSKAAEQPKFHLESERAMHREMEHQRRILDSVGESMSRSALLQELMLSDPEDLLERLDDAIAGNNLATVYLASLASKNRDTKLRSKVTQRLISVKVSERDEALGHVNELKSIRQAASSTLALMKGTKQSDPHRSVRRIQKEQDEAARILLEVAAATAQ